MSTITVSVTHANGKWTASDVTARRGDRLTWTWPANAKLTICHKVLGNSCRVFTPATTDLPVAVPTGIPDGYYCYILLIEINGTTKYVYGAAQGDCTESLIPGGAGAHLRALGLDPEDVPAGVRPRMRVQGDA